MITMKYARFLFYAALAVLCASAWHPFSRDMVTFIKGLM